MTFVVWRMMLCSRVCFICRMNFNIRTHIRTGLRLRIRTCAHTRSRARNVIRIGQRFSLNIRLVGGTRIRDRTRSIIIMSMRRSTRSGLTVASRTRMTNIMCITIRIRIRCGVYSYV